MPAYAVALIRLVLCNCCYRQVFIINLLKMRKDLQYLAKEQREYLANKIFKKISSGNNTIWADSEQCLNRIKSSLEIKNEKNTHKKR